MISRYTLPEMGKIWEDEFKFQTWLKIEILACEARASFGEIPKADVDVIKKKAKFDVKRILEIEETTKGVIVTSIYPGTPAEKAGIEVGDIILEVEGYKINSESSIFGVFHEFRTGQEVTLKIVRDNKELTKKMFLERK